MDRRNALAALGAATLGSAGLAAADDKKGGAGGHDHHNQGHLKTIHDCADVCNQTAHHCLDLLRKGAGEDRELHARAHELTMDCQAFCHLTAALMARNSPTSAYAHQACADACRDCAKACDQGKDEVMKKCAEACRKCEQACREMAKGHKGHGAPGK